MGGQKKHTRTQIASLARGFLNNNGPINQSDAMRNSPVHLRSQPEVAAKAAGDLFAAVAPACDDLSADTDHLSDPLVSASTAAAAAHGALPERISGVPVAGESVSLPASVCSLVRLSWRLWSANKRTQTQLSARRISVFAGAKIPRRPIFQKLTRGQRRTQVLDPLLLPPRGAG